MCNPDMTIWTDLSRPEDEMRKGSHTCMRFQRHQFQSAHNAAVRLLWLGARLLVEDEEKSAGCCDCPWGAVELVGHHPRPVRILWIEAKPTPSRSQACRGALRIH